jgi:hypothetical protein
MEITDFFSESFHVFEEEIMEMLQGFRCKRESFRISLTDVGCSI